MNKIKIDEEKIHKQIMDNYKKAFFDLLKEKVSSNPPDYDWIVNLYREIKHKLTFFLKKGSPYRISIEEGLDVELFDQMLRNDAFKGIEFYNLVNFIFEKCLELGSPGRDSDVKEKREEIFTLMKNNGTFGDLVPLLIKNANICIDWIHDDLGNLKNHLSSNKK